ncbi:D-glycero-beta-D-manno-heptose-7-phosphate kinase [Candidatus Woesearchaeota archaeon]|nr:D-glycero-beta-D-manno-heptose-7-phosphate kinase [Candidatus Woesearchaeota archaeon]
MKEKLLGILAKFRQKKVMVIGDLMLDKYIWGDVSRISPEAPVQVVRVMKETFAPGGAANVANNAAALGSKVYMVGIVGDDREKDSLIGELTKRNIDTSGIFVDSDRPTTLKVRVLGRSQQLLRVDYEKDSVFHDGISSNILNFFKSNIGNIDAIIVSDYAKGVINPKLARELVRIARENNKIIVVDPKPKHRELYKDVTLITPNHHEAVMMAGKSMDDDNDLDEIGNHLVSSLNTSVLLTKGEKGMSLFEKSGKKSDIPTKAKEVYDVVGAGDTVVAAATLALCSGATLEESAILSNIAAGIKVGKVGTSTVAVEEIEKSIRNEP